MQINIDRIKSRFNNKILKEDIIKIYNDFKKINEVIPFNIGLEETIVKYFKNKLNIEMCISEINDRKREILGYENELRLIRREKFNYLRGKGKLIEFLKSLDNNVLDELLMIGCIRSDENSDVKLERFRNQRDEFNNNYNQLNIESDFGRIKM
jgi:hypothetical protein